MAVDARQPQDHVLAPGEYLYALDNTKAIVGTYVGPHTLTASGNLTPVIWDGNRFVRKDRYDDVTQQFVSISEGFYLELTNPSKNAEHPHPNEGANTTGMTDLHFGRKVVIPGPAYFPLWPRQSHKVIGGHQLRSNQYLLVRVYNDQEALANWDKAVIKKASNGKEAEQAAAKPAQLTTGQLLIIKGTEISFYIPPTGIEVVADRSGSFVREAVTLERMEFCILKEERGEKRYVQGPDVVFPSPTETFVEISGEVKFKPIELTPTSGLKINVIADYTEEDGTKRKKGDELFVLGKEQAIYYPRPEHSPDCRVYHAVAVPKGDGRYVQDLETGDTKLVKGPTMFLPDPRKQKLIRRVLDPNQVQLWYPGNVRALEVNKKLQAELEISGGSILFADKSRVSDTKYDGVPGISPYPGFAVLVVNKSGDRNVIEGPAAIMLEYDQSLMPMELSTGTPKTDSKTIKTVYLQVKNNRVSDKVVGVETKDLVPVDITVAYRVNFEGDDPLKWFQVDNYVRHLTEHARSILRNAVKQVGIEEFYKNPIVIIRDAILGKPVDGTERKGLVFKENAMRVYDVDVLEINIEDAKTAELLEGAQLEALRNTLLVASKERELDKTRRIESAEREIASEKATTASAKIGLEIDQVKKQLEKSLADLASRNTQEEEKLKADQGRQGTIDAISTSTLAREKAKKEQELALTKQEIEQELAKLAQETEEIVKRAGAVDDKLIAALQAFGDKALMEKTAEAMAPLAIFRNSGVLEVFAGLLKGTPLADVLNNFSSNRR